MLARLRKKVEDSEGGFTLIELLVVIIIIGILAAIAIPVFLNQRQKGYDAAAKSDARNLATSEETYLTDNSTYLSLASTALPVTPAPAAFATLGYTPSANVTNVTITTYDTDAAGTAGTNKSASYCVLTKSASGKTYAYNSKQGGLSGTTCPAANP